MKSDKDKKSYHGFAMSKMKDLLFKKSSIENIFMKLFKIEKEVRIAESVKFCYRDGKVVDPKHCLLFSILNNRWCLFFGKKRNKLNQVY